MKNEIWKDIPGYCGKYQASNKGRIRSCKKILKQQIEKGGYTHVVLNRVTKRVHRLIALTFLHNEKKLPEINHKDEDKRNNNIENLEWCTKSYNINYGKRNRIVSEKLKGEKSVHFGKKGRLNKSSKAVTQYDMNMIFIAEYESAHIADEKTGIKFQDICKCARGKRKSAGNFIWKYKE